MTGPNSAPIETKVQAATAGAALATIITWLLDTYVYGDIPTSIQSAISVVIVTAAVFASGYIAPHTPRYNGVQSVDSDDNPRL